MASPTQWTWLWVNSGSWWWTGKPGVLGFMGSQRVGHDWATELNWTDAFWYCIGSSLQYISAAKSKCKAKSHVYLFFSFNISFFHLRNNCFVSKVLMLVTQSCPTLWDHVDCNLPGPSVSGTLQARILGWEVIPFSRGSFQPRDQIRVSCIEGGFFTVWAT